MKQIKKRVYLLDMLRGTLIIYVVYYHFMYDLNDILGSGIPYLYSAWFSGIRDAMSGSLIFLSGVSCHFSGNNVKRGIRTILIALALTAVTRLIMPSQIILFGILHLLGAMMVFYGAAERIADRIRDIKDGKAGKAGAAVLTRCAYSPAGMRARLILTCVFLFLFALSRDIYYGTFGIGKFAVRLPDVLYGSLPMYFLGFAGPYFSADYYPVLPWGMLFFAGSMAGYYFRKKELPGFLYKNFCRPLSFIGRHTMIIYLVHQPLFFGIFFLADKLVK